MFRRAKPLSLPIINEDETDDDSNTNQPAENALTPQRPPHPQLRRAFRDTFKRKLNENLAGISILTIIIVYDLLDRFLGIHVYFSVWMMNAVVLVSLFFLALRETLRAWTRLQGSR